MDQVDIKASNERAAKDRAGLRPMARALTVAARGHAGSSSLSGSARLPQEGSPGCDPTPVWLAALMAVNCQARSNGLNHDVSWHSVAGRALYTNFGAQSENIEPLGVNLPAGDTVAVYWSPGETAYTVEVYSDREKCA